MLKLEVLELVDDGPGFGCMSPDSARTKLVSQVEKLITAKSKQIK